MPTLADIYSAIGSARRRASDFVANPVTSAQQMLGYANDRARVLNEMTAEAAQEKDLYGPASQALGQKLAEAYNPIGMTIIPFGKSKSVAVPAGQDFAAVNPAEVRARQAIDDLVTHSRYFGVDSPADLTQMPIGSALAHLDDYLGNSSKVAELPENAKASLRHLWAKAEDAAKAYKRIYGEEKFMGKMPEPANAESISTKPPWFDQELEDKFARKEINRRHYERQTMKNMENYYKK